MNNTTIKMKRTNGQKKIVRHNVVSNKAAAAATKQKTLRSDVPASNQFDTL